MKYVCLLSATLRRRHCVRLLWSAVLLGCSVLPAQAGLYDNVAFDRARYGYPYGYPYGYGYPYDACYYHGRCTADDLRYLRDRMQRIDRVTPQPPRTEAPALIQRHTDVPPTAVDQIRPEFREASQLREEYRAKADQGGEPGARSGERKTQSEDQSRKDGKSGDY